jgi:hypothetical protein
MRLSKNREEVKNEYSMAGRFYLRLSAIDFFVGGEKSSFDFASFDRLSIGSADFWSVQAFMDFCIG